MSKLSTQPKSEWCQRKRILKKLPRRVILIDPVTRPNEKPPEGRPFVQTCWSRIIRSTDQYLATTAGVSHLKLMPIRTVLNASLTDVLGTAPGPPTIAPNGVPRPRSMYWYSPFTDQCGSKAYSRPKPTANPLREVESVKRAVAGLLGVVTKMLSVT